MQETSKRIEDVPKREYNDRLPCSSCSITCYSLEEFIKHTATEKHIFLVLKEKFEGKNTSMCDSTTELDGDLYNKDVVPQKNEKFNSSINMPPYSGCYAYDKTFKGAEQCQSQISDSHKKQYDVPIDGNPASVASRNSIVSPSLNESWSCDVCVKVFSGSAPYQQHLDSNNHKKKMLLANNNGGTASNGSISCGICKIECSSPFNYDQHLKGEAHKKNVAKLGYNGMEVNSNSGVQANATSSYFCRTCLIPCSGPIPWEQHLASDGHRKKAIRSQAESKKGEIQNLFSKNEEFKASASKAIPAETHGDLTENKKLNNLSSDLATEINETFGLNLNHVRPSDLEVVFFNVGEPIDFDKTVKNNIEIFDLELTDDDISMEDNADMN